MLVTATLVLTLGLVNAQSVVDPFQCIDGFGDWGVTINCPSGYVATGICSSGEFDACKGGEEYSALRCCAVVSTKNTCELQEGIYGDYVSCPDNGVVTSLCTSGLTSDCGNDVWTRLLCCDDTGLQVTGVCEWIHGNYGQLVTCQSDEVITGACTSAREPACSGDGISIRCCTYN